MQKRREDYSRYEKQEGLDEFKTVVVYSALGISTATGLMLLARHFYRKMLQNKVQRVNLIEGNPATIATQLYMALGNEHWYASSNKDAVFQKLRSITSKAAYVKVQKAYSDNYKENLNSDLEKRLTADEYNQAIRMLSAKPSR